MYHAPGGDRVLLDAERRFFTQSLAMIGDLLAEGDIDFGVIPFDELQRNQKLVVPYRPACGLLLPNEPTPKLTALMESAVTVVYEHAKHQVYQEIDTPEFAAATSFWRRLVIDAARGVLMQLVGRAVPVSCLHTGLLPPESVRFQPSVGLLVPTSRGFSMAVPLSDPGQIEAPHDVRSASRVCVVIHSELSPLGAYSEFVHQQGPDRHRTNELAPPSAYSCR